MTVTVVTQDLTALPNDLLAAAKTHLRVDWAYDDDYIKSVIARAIARFEQVNEVTVNPTAVHWTPKETDFKDGAATLPVRPAKLATPMAGYAVVLKWDSIHGVPILTLQGAAAAVSVDLLCGYATAGDIPPAVQDVVMRHTAHLFEHREILVPGSREYVAPDLQMDATWWMPRA